MPNTCVMYFCCVIIKLADKLLPFLEASHYRGAFSISGLEYVYGRV